MVKKAQPIGHATVYFCGPCQRYFRDRQSISSHQSCSKIHNPTCICPDCSTGFSSENSLVQHLARFCNKSFPVQHYCMSCVKIFPSESHLAAHFESEEHHNKLHRCDECAMVFKSEAGMKHHMQMTRRHHPHDDVTSCWICGGTFVNDEDVLQGHMRTAHRKGDRKRDRVSNKAKGNRREPLISGNPRPGQQSKDNRQQTQRGRAERVVRRSSPALVNGNAMPKHGQPSVTNRQTIQDPNNGRKPWEWEENQQTGNGRKPNSPKKTNGAPEVPAGQTTTIPQNNSTDTTPTYSPKRPSIAWVLNQPPKRKVDGSILYETPSSQEVEDEDAKYVQNARPGGFAVEILRTKLISELKPAELAARARKQESGKPTGVVGTNLAINTILTADGKLKNVAEVHAQAAAVSGSAKVAKGNTHSTKSPKNVYKHDVTPRMSPQMNDMLLIDIDIEEMSPHTATTMFVPGSPGISSHHTPSTKNPKKFGKEDIHYQKAVAASGISLIDIGIDEVHSHTATIYIPGYPDSVSEHTSSTKVAKEVYKFATINDMPLIDVGFDLETPCYVSPTFPVENPKAKFSRKVDDYHLTSFAFSDTESTVSLDDTFFAIKESQAVRSSPTMSKLPIDHMPPKGFVGVCGMFVEESMLELLEDLVRF